jgi:hypothetical protein
MRLAAKTLIFLVAFHVALWGARQAPEAPRVITCVTHGTGAALICTDTH